MCGTLVSDWDAQPTTADVTNTSHNEKKRLRFIASMCLSYRSNLVSTRCPVHLIPVRRKVMDRMENLLPQNCSRRGFEIVSQMHLHRRLQLWDLEENRLSVP